MLTANQLRQIAGRPSARDIGNVEIDVILTYLLHLFADKGIMGHVGFKGGTMLRKMVFGPRGRLSTDLDPRVLPRQRHTRLLQRIHQWNMELRPVGS
jgi:predicted nucleotidyltransferase component of viral defense system